MKNAEWETKEDPEIVLKVKEAQIRQLYQQSLTGLVGVLVVAVSVCFILWQEVPSWKLALWLVLFTLITFSRAYLTFAFIRQNRIVVNINRWANWHTIGTSASGLMWAVSSFYLWPENSPKYFLVWAICVLPLSASAVTTYYSWKPSYIAFLLLSAAPISLRFFLEGEMIFTVLGFLTLFFIAILFHAGASIHSAYLHSLIIGYRNEALSSYLTEEKLKQEELTQQLQKAHNQLLKVSLTDELTGLWNRRYFNDTIQKDVDQVLRHYQKNRQNREKMSTSETNIVFIMVDLDHFKSVNDNYGHAAGDQILIQMRDLLSTSYRKMDTTIRWGGEEFLIVLRNVSREDYTLHIERIRLAVETHQFDINKKESVQLTCSIGAAVFPFLTNSPEEMSWEKVVYLADACLYAAKRSGRNAWVGIIPTTLATSKDFKPHFTNNLPGLIQQGKLEMKTNLKDNDIVFWSD
ncbi:MAG: GGDEF domain-containing protein [Candidatus Thiodiazotropha sp. L084R]